MSGSPKRVKRARSRSPSPRHSSSSLKKQRVDYTLFTQDDEKTQLIKILNEGNVGDIVNFQGNNELDSVLYKIVTKDGEKVIELLKESSRSPSRSPSPSPEIKARLVHKKFGDNHYIINEKDRYLTQYLKPGATVSIVSQGYGAEKYVVDKEHGENVLRKISGGGRKTRHTKRTRKTKTKRTRKTKTKRTRKY